MASARSGRYPVKHILINYINNIVFGEIDENECINLLENTKPKNTKEMV